MLAQGLNISDCFLCLSLPVSLCVCGGDDVNVCLIWLLYLCMFVCLGTLCCLFCTVLSCLWLSLSPGSTLSAQSVPTMYPGQLALLAPGGLADACSNTLLQPLKPCPSSNNLCSAYTSEGALSVPSLCAPTPGRHVAENCILQHRSRASTQNTNACILTRQTPCFCLSPSVSLSV